MDDVTKDLNTGQSVAGQEDLNKVPVVTEPDLKASGQGEQVATLADGDDESTKTVKYEEFKKANEAKKVAEERAQLAESQIALINANQQQQVVQSQPQQPLSDYDQAKADLGLTGVEFIEEAERGKIYVRINEITQARNRQTSAAMANQQFEGTHTDFTSVVGLRNPLTGVVQPSAEILEILKEKPYLTAAAYASSQGAYEIVMNEREVTKLKEQTTIQEEHLKGQGIETKLAPVSGAAAAGGAIQASSGSVSVEQQQEMEAKVAAGEFNT